MKRLLLWIFTLVGVVSCIIIVAAYGFARANISKIPALAKTALKSNGLELGFQTVEVANSGLSLTLRELTLSGKDFGFPVTAPSAKFSIRLLASNKPVLFAVRLEKPILQKATPPSSRESSSTAAPAAPPPFYLAPILGLVQFELSIDDADLHDFGAEGVTASLRLKNLALGARGLEKARLTHHIHVKKLADAPWLPEVSTQGRINFEHQTIEVADGTIELGPFRMGMRARIALQPKTWKVEVSLPETELSSASRYINSQATKWLTRISGKFGLNAVAEGTGFVPDKDLVISAASGNLLASRLSMVLAHPQAKGTITLDAKGKFLMNPKPLFDFTVTTDLSAAELSQGDLFKKATGVPLHVSATGSGKEKLVQINNLALAFHNLKSLSKGSYRWDGEGKNSTADINVQINETDLAGWESFFPRYAKVKTKGTLKGSLVYRGPIQEWKKCKIEADLKAANVTFPLLSEWFTSGGLHAEGIAQMNSDTQFSINAGTLETLSTISHLSLEEAELVYADYFEKKKKTPFMIDLNMGSKGQRSEIRKSSFQVGNLAGKISGLIKNLQHPVADLNLAIEPFQIDDIRRLSPAVKKNLPIPPKGQLAIKGKITGPVLDPKIRPSFNGSLNLAGLAFQYELASKKKIDVRNLSGIIAIASDGLSTDKLLVQTPGTSAVMAFRVNSFENPDISFQVKADRFKLADFYQQAPADKSVPFAVVPVTTATQSPTGKAEDFRANPWLKKVRLQGSLTMKDADLGATKSELVTGRLKYDNLVLDIDPLAMKTFGGTVTTSTHWDGRKDQPESTIDIKAADVDANLFLGHWSESIKDVVFGQLGSTMRFSFKGLSPDIIKKSLAGNGSFALNNGQLKTLKLTQKPMEALRKIPGLSGFSGADVQEKLNQVTGSFKDEDGKVLLSNIALRSGQFDAETSLLSVDFDLNLSGKLVWYPKENLVGTQVYQLLKDETGRSSLPLSLTGSLLSPTVGLDSGLVIARLKQTSARQVAEQLKAVVPKELENKVKEGLRGLFK